MPPNPFNGRRIPDGEFFERRNSDSLEPGDYGVEEITKRRGGVEVEHRDVFVCCPDGIAIQLWVNEDDPRGKRHVVTEHEDGSMSVEGSIMSPGGWHGHLRRGVWEQV